MVFAMASVCSIAGTSRVAGHTRGVPRVTAATSGGRPVAFPARTSRAHSATRVAVPRGCAVPLGLAMTQLPRGSLLAARARKGKKAVPEPVVEDEDDEDDEADAFDRDADADADDADADADDADADDADFLTEDEQTADDTEFAEVEETRDARDLLPKSTKGIKKKTQVQVMEDDVGALRTAVGYVQSAVQNPAVRNGGILVGCVLAGSFSLSAYNVYMRYNSNKSKRKRQVNKNVVVVERLRDFFPQNRDSLTKGHVAGLVGKTGFAPAEIFRKYVRYKLNEEPFTVDFVADVLALRRACELDGDTAMNVLLETGTRIVKKYGILMRDVSAMSSEAALKRKIDGASMFVKVMFLADLEEFVPAEQGKEVKQRLKEIFGATDEDYEKLKITSLGNADVDVLNAMIGAKKGKDGDEDKGGEGASA